MKRVFQTLAAGAGAVTDLQGGIVWPRKSKGGSGAGFSSGGAPVDPATQLRFTVVIPSDGYSLPIATSATKLYDGVINYGDGSSDLTFTAYDDASLTHTYSSAGTYNIAISGTFEHLNTRYTGAFTSVLKSINNIGNTGLKTMEYMGGSSTSTLFESFTFGDGDISLVTSAKGMFQSIPTAFTTDWAGSGDNLITNIQDMYASSKATVINITGLDTSRVAIATAFAQNAYWCDNVIMTGCNFELMSSFSQMMSNVGVLSATGSLTTESYSNILSSWGAQDMQNSKAFYVGTAKYNDLGEIGRNSLINDDLWTIGDGGKLTNDAFQTTWTTTSDSQTIVIPARSGFSYSGTINWGDGSGDLSFSAYNDSNFTHTYATAGTYQVSIEGTFETIYFNNTGDKLYIDSVDNLGDVGWSRLQNSFYGCSNMTSFIAGDCDTSANTHLSSLFRGGSSLVTVDFSTMDTSSVQYWDKIFNSCSSLVNPDMSNTDTSAMLNAAYMFYNCTQTTELDLSSWTDIESCTTFVGFLGNVTLDTDQYDAILINFAGQNPIDNLSFAGGNSQYSAGAATTARDKLVNTDNWTIVDGGQA